MTLGVWQKNAYFSIYTNGQYQWTTDYIYIYIYIYIYTHTHTHTHTLSLSLSIYIYIYQSYTHTSVHNLCKSSLQTDWFITVTNIITHWLQDGTDLACLPLLQLILLWLGFLSWLYILRLEFEGWLGLWRLSPQSVLMQLQQKGRAILGSQSLSYLLNQNYERNQQRSCRLLLV